MSQPAAFNLSALQRPSGAFAMLAVDQREAMRQMFAAHQNMPVSDQQVSDFKLRATKILTPYASAVLVDRQFAWERVVSEEAAHPHCGLIASADEFIAGPDEIVGDVIIDELMVPERAREQGAVAMKLLVLWRPDEAPDARVAMVKDFVARCRRAGLISIIEPISRKPRNNGAFDWNAGVHAAAAELGNLGADLYKAEVPLKGEGDEKTLRDECARLTKAIVSPWVVLSSGVTQDRFPQAVEWACREGASGFLAGRAVWSGVIGARDIDQALLSDAVPRLQRLCDVVDRVVGQ